MTPLLRRSELAVPAANDHMFAKALSCGADLVFLDLEDAVPPTFKEESREKAIAALTGALPSLLLFCRKSKLGTLGDQYSCDCLEFLYGVT